MKKSQLMLKIQNSIEVFENPIFGQIRMSMVDDEPMFALLMFAGHWKCQTAVLLLID